jgi:hypothetical protein
LILVPQIQGTGSDLPEPCPRNGNTKFPVTHQQRWCHTRAQF